MSVDQPGDNENESPKPRNPSGARIQSETLTLTEESRTPPRFGTIRDLPVFQDGAPAKIPTLSGLMLDLTPPPQTRIPNLPEGKSLDANVYISLRPYIDSILDISEQISQMQQIISLDQEQRTIYTRIHFSNEISSHSGVFKIEPEVFDTSEIIEVALARLSGRVDELLAILPTENNSEKINTWRNCVGSLSLSTSSTYKAVKNHLLNEAAANDLQPSFESRKTQLFNEIRSLLQNGLNGHIEIFLILSNFIKYYEDSPDFSVEEQEITGQKKLLILLQKICEIIDAKIGIKVKNIIDLKKELAKLHYHSQFLKKNNSDSVFFQQKIREKERQFNQLRREIDENLRELDKAFDALIYLTTLGNYSSERQDYEITQTTAVFVDNYLWENYTDNFFHNDETPAEKILAVRVIRNFRANIARHIAPFILSGMSEDQIRQDLKLLFELDPEEIRLAIRQGSLDKMPQAPAKDPRKQPEASPSPEPIRKSTRHIRRLALAAALVAGTAGTAIFGLRENPHQPTTPASITRATQIETATALKPLEIPEKHPRFEVETKESEGTEDLRRWR